jgi:hypothetical protein
VSAAVNANVELKQRGCWILALAPIAVVEAIRVADVIVVVSPEPDSVGFAAIKAKRCPVALATNAIVAVTMYKPVVWTVKVVPDPPNIPSVSYVSAPKFIARIDAFAMFTDELRVTLTAGGTIKLFTSVAMMLCAAAV